MPDRTQTLSVDLERDEIEALWGLGKWQWSGPVGSARAKLSAALSRRDTDAHGYSKRIAEKYGGCSCSADEPEHQGDEDGPRVPDGGDPCPYCKALPGEPHTSGCLKNPKPAQVQPPVPVLSDEERERAEQVAQKIEEAMADHGAGFTLADATFLRNLASREHRRERPLWSPPPSDETYVPAEKYGRPPAGEVERLRERLLDDEIIDGILQRLHCLGATRADVREALEPAISALVGDDA